MIIRELLDRGEVNRFAVLCPSQLAEQWQKELREKFHLEAELVLPSTAAKLERRCRLGQSLFDVYPFVVISTDFIKSERRLNEFLRTCPELVVVDEAHTCAWSGEGKSGARHQRHQLIEKLTADAKRHLILVSATPHSGNENAFYSLLSLLNPDFANLPRDLSGSSNEKYRRVLATHLIQRRRGDIKRYLNTETPFPERKEAEEQYTLTSTYRAFMDKVLKYAREAVEDKTGTRQQQRIRWWSALSLLSCISSSPAAAETTLRSRAAVANAATPEEADALGKRSVMDLIDDESTEDADVTPGSDIFAEDDDGQKNRRRLLELAREAEKLRGAQDAKLQTAIRHVKSLLDEGFNPIVFCRYIQTAEYVAEALRSKIKGVEVDCVTGTLPPTERETRVVALGDADKRVLVCTDCLSEGINLQEHFDSVFHYDLSWNPTRHEQREGRVDRYGQPNKEIRVLTYYGKDNPIDGIVLDVLLKKHRSIRNSLGISVPVPLETDKVVEAIFEGLLLRGSARQTNYAQLNLAFDDLFDVEKKALHAHWEKSADREKRSRTLFAQDSIKVDEVAQELQSMRAAIGSGVEVANFMTVALQALGATVSRNGVLHCDLSGVEKAARESVGDIKAFTARFELPLKKRGEIYLNRTYPIVEGLASYVMDTALDPFGKGVARRSGAIRTDRVSRRTTILLVRYRFHILSKFEDKERALLAEDLGLLAFEGSPSNAQWLDLTVAETLLTAEPKANITADAAAPFVQRVIDAFDSLREHLHFVADSKGQELLDAHTRVRKAARIRGVAHSIQAQSPPDVLGIYVYLPVGA
jgi:hypothetical protein